MSIRGNHQSDILDPMTWIHHVNIPTHGYKYTLHAFKNEYIYLNHLNVLVYNITKECLRI